MKKVIRWLSNATGVTSDVQREVREQIGSNMKDYAYWFSYVDEKEVGISNLLSLYSEYTFDQGRNVLYGCRPDELRDRIRSLSKEKICITAKQQTTPTNV